jgi:hypothetical protein
MKSNKKISNKKLDVIKKKLEKFGYKKPVNLVNVMSDLKILIIFYIIFIFIYILIVSGIINYINKIKDCNCFKEKNNIYSVNITYIYVIEIIILILSIFSLVSFIYLYIMNNYVINKLKGGSKSIFNTYLIAYLISLLINGYLLYNIYKLVNIPEDNCNCDKSSLKKLLYIQSILIMINLILYPVILINNII